MKTLLLAPFALLLFASATNEGVLGGSTSVNGTAVTPAQVKTSTVLADAGYIDTLNARQVTAQTLKATGIDAGFGDFQGPVNVNGVLTVASNNNLYMSNTGANCRLNSDGVNLYLANCPVEAYLQPLTVDGLLTATGGVHAAAEITSTSSKTSGTYPCDGGTPSPTVTVTSGVHCVCGGLGAACTVSGTTLTTHCSASDTGSPGYLCL